MDIMDEDSLLLREMEKLLNIYISALFISASCFSFY